MAVKAVVSIETVHYGNNKTTTIQFPIHDQVFSKFARLIVSVDLKSYTNSLKLQLNSNKNKKAELTTIITKAV